MSIVVVVVVYRFTGIPMINAVGEDVIDDDRDNDNEITSP